MARYKLHGPALGHNNATSLCGPFEINVDQFVANILVVKTQLETPKRCSEAASQLWSKMDRNPISLGWVYGMLFR